MKLIATGLVAVFFATTFSGTESHYAFSQTTTDQADDATKQVVPSEAKNVLEEIASGSTSWFSPSQTVNSHQAAAAELVDLVSPKQSFVTAFLVGLQPMVEQLATSGASPEQLAQIKTASVELASDVASDTDFSSGMLGIYTEGFTETELRGLIDFYKTPLGKKSLTKMGELMKKGRKLGQTATAKHAAQFQAKVKEIVSKKQKP